MNFYTISSELKGDSWKSDFLLGFSEGRSSKTSKRDFLRVRIFEGFGGGILNFDIISSELKGDSWKSDLSQGKSSEKV